MFNSRRFAVAASVRDTRPTAPGSALRLVPPVPCLFLLGCVALTGALPTDALAANPKKTPRKPAVRRSVNKKVMNTPTAMPSGKVSLKDAAQKAVVPRSEFISVDEIKPGMKGYGLTVFKGTKIERFPVTVIDVLRGGIGPTLGRDVIMIRTFGPVFEKRKAMTIGGMSGSPIYINGRLAGAYAYGAEAQNEPVAFVTPIAAMLEAWDAKLPNKPLFSSAPPTLPGLGGGSPVAAAGLLPNRLQGMQLAQNGMTFNASGLSAPVLQRLNASVSPLGIRFQQTVAGGKSKLADNAPPLQPGSTFGFSLATGDIELGQSGGTVTYRRGKRVLTLGHPGLGMLGPMEVPMTTSYVADVLSNLLNSTKLQFNGSVIGSLTQDTAFGTAGVVGQMPQLADVSVNVNNTVSGQKRSMRSKVMKHPMLTSRIIWSVADEAIYRMHTFPGDSMAQVKLSIKGKGIQPITRTNFYYAPFFIDVFALQDLEDLLGILTQNEFGPVDVRSVNVDVNILPGRNSLRIERAFVDRETVEPGETVQVGVVLRPWRKEPYVKTVSIKVPENTPNGRTQIVLTSGATPVNIAPAGPPGAPGGAPVGVASGPMYRNVQQMIDRYLELGSNSQLVTRLFLTAPGVNILGERLYDVPAPIGDVLRSPKSSGYRQERDAVKKIDDMNAYVFGSAIVPINIERSSYQEQGRTTARPAPRTPTTGTGSTPSPSTSVPPSTSTGDLLDEMDPNRAPQLPYSPLSINTVSPTLRALGMFPETEGYGVYTPSFLAPKPVYLQWSEPHAASKPAAEEKDEDKDEKKPVGSAKVSSDAAETAEAKTEEKKDDKPAATDSDDKTKGPGRTATLWTQKTKAQFERGDGKGVGVTTLGDIRLAPTLKRRDLLEQESQVWTMLPDGADGYYVGTGSNGNIYHMTADGKLGEPIKTQDLAIRTLTRGKNGEVFAGGWPSGTIYRVEGGKATPFVKTDARYVLALVTDDAGNLYAAVGPGGKVLKITPSGVSSTFFQTSQPHVLSLAFDMGGNLIVGTSDSGALYRVDPSGKSTVLYDPEDNAVTALMVDGDGDIYAGTSPKGRILDIKPNGTTQVVYEAGAPIMALEQDNEGNLYAGAGTGIIRLDSNEVITRLDTQDQNQILCLKWTEKGGLWAASGNLAAIYQTEAQKGAGEYLSAVHDSKNPSRWGRVSWQARVPKGGNVTLETRTGNTVEPDASWSGWSGAYTESNGAAISSPRGRFIQYRAKLTAGEGDESPELKSVTVSYLSENRKPSVAFTAPSVADVWSEKQTIRWNGSDPDKDTLTYDIFYSADGGNTWKPIKGQTKTETKPADTSGTTAEAKPAGDADAESPDSPQAQEVMNKLQSEIDKDSTISAEDKALLEAVLPAVVKDAVANPASKEIKPDPAPAGAPATDKPLSETSYSWDTKEVPDGEYFLKVVATDKRSNPGSALTDEQVLGPITVLNEKPKVEISDRTAEVKDRAVTARGTTNGGRAAIATVSYRVDKGEWSAAEAEDGLFDSPVETYRIVTDPLPAGEHTIEVRSTTVGNLNGTSSMKITVK